MMQAVFAAAGFWQRELLLFCAVWFAVGALDDLAIDVAWLCRRGWRHVRHYRGTPPMRSCAMDAPAPDGAAIAVFVAAWSERGVIGPMIAETTRRWAGERYRLYVGCYPNDHATVAEAMRAAHERPDVRVVLHVRTGPTTKADCLNRLWQALRDDEAQGAIVTSMVVLHDAEDLVAPAALRVYRHLIGRADFIQLPVVPLAVPGSRWISGHYCDEFAEAHGKQMVVREAIGAGLPAAGVGCAISRAMLGMVAARRGGGPFDATSLTEDYELGLSVAELGGRSMHVRIRDAAACLVATRAHFPARLGEAVRQKSRWIAGIALAGWDRMGWRGGLAETWMRLRDRRGTFSALVLAAAYLAVLDTGAVMLGEALGYRSARPLGAPLLHLLQANAIMLTLRLAVRAAFVKAEYGWAAALTSIPRAIVSNLVALLAARRAVFLYARHCLGGTLAWDKTDHRFPVSTA